MATGSTASSRTERHEPQPDPGSGSATEAAAGEAPTAPARSPARADAVSHDPARRAFFLEFGRQAVTAAGQVAGVADLVNRASGSGVADLLGLGRRSGAPAAREFVRTDSSAVVSAVAPPADDSFRSPYRVAGNELILLDQRGVPESLTEVSARRGSDVAYYLRLGVVRGGPLAAQVAAYGLALTCAERAEQPGDQLDLELRRTHAALVDAHPSSRYIGWALERVRAAMPALHREVSGTELARALRAEADAIATDVAAWNAAIAEHLAETLAAVGRGPLSLLLHGDHGALHGGVVGTALPALQRLRDEGRPLRVFVTEGRPRLDGARLASWELRQAGIEHRLIADGAVAWLLERERPHAVLINAEWVASNGDAAGLVGSRAVALLAAESATQVIVSGLSAIIDAATPDGSAIPDELRPARDLAAYLAAVPIRASDALVPVSDVMPASRIDALVTERGVSTPGATS